MDGTIPKGPITSNTFTVLDCGHTTRDEQLPALYHDVSHQISYLWQYPLRVNWYAYAQEEWRNESDGSDGDEVIISLGYGAHNLPDNLRTIFVTKSIVKGAACSRDQRRGFIFCNSR